MEIGDDHRRTTWKILRRVASLFRGKLPPWAIALLVLFGGGGVFYAGFDFLKTHMPKTPPAHDVMPALPVEIKALFFPAYRTVMPSGVSLEVVDSGTATLPNLKLAVDSGSTHLQSCEVRAVDRIVAEPVKTETGNYIVTFAQLLPNERIQIYCLAENPQKITVTLNATDSEGKTLGSAQETFSRSTEVRESGFQGFVTIVADCILAAVGLCLIFILFGLTGRLAAWLGLYPEEKKSNPPSDPSKT